MNQLSSLKWRLHARLFVFAVILTSAAACRRNLQISAPETILPASNAWALAVDQENIYWFADGLVKQAPRKSPSTGVVTLGSATFVNSIAADGNNVYWTNLGEVSGDSLLPDSGAIMKASVGGGTLTTLAPQQNFPRQLVINDKSVFWINFNALMSAPLEGPTSSPTLLAGGADLGGIAIDDTSVYWTDRPSSYAGHGLLKKIPLAGGMNSTLYGDLSGPGDLMLDGNELIWLDVGTYIPEDGKNYLQFDGKLLHQKKTDALYTAYADGQQLPASLAQADGVIYWVNAQLDYMGKTYPGSVSAYGPHGVQIIAKEDGDCRYVTAIGSDVYWTNEQGIRHATVR